MRGALVAVVVAVLAACQFQPRGAEVDASGTDDASPAIDADLGGDGSTTTTIDGRTPDAAPSIDAAACPAACTSCRADGTCVIDCGAAQCMSGVTCPPGRPCVVNCAGTAACETGVVNCLQATTCEINCLGTDACDAGVNCAGASCTVVCQGTAACEDGGVDCTADSCDITCTGWNACDAHVCCRGDDCPANDCQATSGACCSCDGCGN